MGCVNPDGSLTPVALKVLRALSTISGAGAAETVARATGLPMYRARASLRELEGAGLVTGGTGEDAHRLSSAGAARLEALAAQPTP